MKNNELDLIDFKLLNIKIKNPEISYREIEKELGISLGTIHNRLEKLKQEGFIEGIYLKLNDLKLGYNLHFIFMIQIETKDLEKTCNELSHLPDVYTCFLIDNAYSVILLCKFKNIETANNFEEDLNKRDDVIRTISYLIKKEKSNNFNTEHIKGLLFEYL